MARKFQILLFLAWRSLWSHKTKNLIVGSLMFFGTLVVAAGSAVIDTMERTMAESIISSLAGHVQVYSSKATDELALFGSAIMAREDVGFIPDFERVRDELGALPEVRTVVPMALDTAQVVGGNDYDRLLDSVRQALAAHDATLVDELTHLLRVSSAELLADYEKQRSLMNLGEDEEKAVAALRIASGEDFWRDFPSQAEKKLEFLDLQVARHADQFDMPMYVRYLATDPALFASTFSKFEIVQGAPIPPGERGFLFNLRFYNEAFRNRVVNRLEKLREGLDEGRTLAGDPKLRSLVEKNAKEYMRVIMRIRPGKLADLDAALQAAREAFPSDKSLRDSSERGALLRAFLSMSDGDARARLAFFDGRIRPLLREYEVAVGDTLNIRSFTRSGYMRTAAVKVHGVFRFKGIDRSDIAGSHNIIDLATFRELYGFLTADKKSEMESIKSQAGVEDISRDDAEAALFGGEPSPKSSPAATPAPQVSPLLTEHDSPVLNAAVILKNPKEIGKGLASIRKRVGERGLGLKAVDWQEASGMVGQFVVIVRAVLVVSSLLVFLAALVIINNSMIISTMERTSEIGTMRAIGAQRTFVLSLFVLETLILGLFVGLLGVAAAAALVRFLGSVGIPAASDQLAFLFGGERLYPVFSIGNLLLGLGSVLVVSILAAFYPARVAARVQPIVALQAKE